MSQKFTEVEISILQFLKAEDSNSSHSNCAKIAKKLDLSIQTISYNLKKLVHKGLIFNGFENNYFIQPFLKNEAIYNLFVSFLIDLLNEFHPDIITDSENTSQEFIIENNIIALLLLNINELTENTF